MKNKSILLFLLALGLGLVSTGAFRNQPDSSAQATLFFDDFNGVKLDRSKWNVETTHEVYNREQQAYVDSACTLYIARGAEAQGAHGGALVIKPVFSEGYTGFKGLKANFLSARITTEAKMQFTYGTLAARMKLPVGEGFWPAFWALGVGNWPQCGEIDVMENVGQAGWVSAALHGPGYFGNTPLVKKTFLKAGHGIEEWHVYSVDWTSHSLIFKIDGVPFYTVPRSKVESYGPWAFDKPKFLILNCALGGNYPAKVNGINSPYYGLPQTSVEAIKAAKVKVLIDWVKVTRL